MLDKDIYEVEYNDYIGYMGQLKKDCYESVIETRDDTEKELLITSKATGNILASQVVNKDNESRYYVYKMPLDSERQAPPLIRRIELKTPEEVKAVFEVLNNLKKKPNDD